MKPKKKSLNLRCRSNQDVVRLLPERQNLRRLLRQYERLLRQCQTGIATLEPVVQRLNEVDFVYRGTPFCRTGFRPNQIRYFSPFADRIAEFYPNGDCPGKFGLRLRQNDQELFCGFGWARSTADQAAKDFVATGQTPKFFYWTEGGKTVRRPAETNWT